MYEGKPLESDLPANNYFFVKLQSVTALVDFSFLRVRTRISCLLVIRSLYVLVNSVYRSTFFSLSLSLSLSLSHALLLYLRSFSILIQWSPSAKKPRVRRTTCADQSE